MGINALFLMVHHIFQGFLPADKYESKARVDLYWGDNYLVDNPENLYGLYLNISVIDMHPRAILICIRKYK